MMTNDEMRSMTTLETMVWAAVFAKHFDIGNPPAHVMPHAHGGNDAPWGEWERGQAQEAGSHANGAVEYLREIRSDDA